MDSFLEGGYREVGVFGMELCDRAAFVEHRRKEVQRVTYTVPSTFFLAYAPRVFALSTLPTTKTKPSD